MSSSADSTVLGVVLLIRHGDRQGFYQDPNTYAASATAITPLGNQQEIALGALMRQLYLNASSMTHGHVKTANSRCLQAGDGPWPSHIPSMDTGLFNATQVKIRADAGDEGGVIYDSAVSLTQGLWPATDSYNTTLANGMTVTGPLGGYQYVPVESVGTNDISLEGFASCNTFNNAINDFYNSSEFQQKAQQSQAFLSELPPYLDGRPVMLQNMWNIFDYMNVNSIHNANFSNSLPPTFLAQARDLANWHEYNTFTSNQPSGISNIAGRTVLPDMVTGIQRIANVSDPLSFMLDAISYKPFLSLFNMTEATSADPALANIVEYAAAWALEVRQPSAGGEPVLRFNFKNGSADDFHTYNFLGQTSDVPVSTFLSTLAPSAVNTTAQWCGVCGNSQDRGCGLLAQASAAARTHQDITPVGAGFLGAGLTAAVFLMLLGALAFFGVLTFGRHRHYHRKGVHSPEGSVDAKA